MFEHTSEQLLPTLIVIVEALQSGVFISGLMVVSHRCAHRLSQYMDLAQPDQLNEFMKLFHDFYDASFGKIGRVAALQAKSTVTQQIAYYLGVGSSYIAASMIVYIMSAVAILMGSIAVYLSLGVFIDPVPLFRQVIAALVIAALAVMFHAEDQARQIATYS